METLDKSWAKGQDVKMIPKSPYNLETSLSLSLPPQLPLSIFSAPEQISWENQSRKKWSWLKVLVTAVCGHLALFFLGLWWGRTSWREVASEKLLLLCSGKKAERQTEMGLWNISYLSKMLSQWSIFLYVGPVFNTAIAYPVWVYQKMSPFVKVNPPGSNHFSQNYPCLYWGPSSHVNLLWGVLISKP